ncbi:MAG: pseudouridine synthase [Bdellovibrionales bacterium]|nr:pseudouridine synthase [Bdellovibrionales bacterium]
MSIERLQKILAQAGIASRRKAEELIEQGLVTVNGTVAKLGDKADFTSDHIKVEGKLLRKLEDLFYVVFNKPKGVISMMSDPEGRPTIADFLSKMKVHLNPIGRLDFNSDGLLLLTNDGAMAEKIQKSDKFPRIYHVKVKGHITTEMIDRLSRGGLVGDKRVKPLSVRINEELNKKTRIEIVFLNAANVDVKGYFETKGFLVEKITRSGIGHLTLHGLEPGKFRIVNKEKFEALFAQPELGVKALEHRLATERAILPRDQRLRNVDEHGKILPKVGAGAEERIPNRIAVKSSAPAATSGTKGDRIVIRAAGDATPAPKKFGAKKSYSSSVDMPKFKKRTASSAGRFSSGPRDRDEGERRPMTRFGGGGPKPRRDDGDRPAFGRRDGKPRFNSRPEGRSERSERPEGRFGRSEGRGFGRGPGRGENRAPRSEGRAPRAEGRSFSRRPIARVKKRED